MSPYLRDALAEAAASLERLRNDETTLEAIDHAARALTETLGNSRRVYTCGNGGSMSDAMHLAEELSGRYRQNRPPLGGIAISDPSYLTCVANDFGYEQVFARFVEAHGRAGDCLVGISTSGSSANIINAARVASERGLTVISLTGKRESALGALADYDICTPAGRYADRVQELHIKVIHILVELVERALFPANYA